MSLETKMKHPYVCPKCSWKGEYTGKHTFQFQCPNCNQRLYIVDDGVQLKPNKKV